MSLQNAKVKTSAWGVWEKRWVCGTDRPPICGGSVSEGPHPCSFQIPAQPTLVWRPLFLLLGLEQPSDRCRLLLASLGCPGLDRWSLAGIQISRPLGVRCGLPRLASAVHSGPRPARRPPREVFRKNADECFRTAERSISRNIGSSRKSTTFRRPSPENPQNEGFDRATSWGPGRDRRPCARHRGRSTVAL